MIFRLDVLKISKIFRVLSNYYKLTFPNKPECTFGVQRRTMSEASDQLQCCIAVGQLTSTGDKNTNIEMVQTLANKATAEHNAKMLFLPEACDYIVGNSELLTSMAESLDGPTVNKYKEIASNNNLWISVGVHEKTQEMKVYNTQLLINNHGDIVSSYRKVHLFDAKVSQGSSGTLRESATITAGRSIIPPIKTPAGMLGLLICYDLRFPEMSTQLREMGADILTYPSAFTCSTGEAHWEPLLRARAIENQCYVIAAAQYGKHCENRQSHGRTLIIDPWGTILAECPKFSPNNNVKTELPQLAVANIDHSTLLKVRSSMPVLNHRRPDIYIKGSTLPRNNDNLNCDMSFADKIIPADTIFYRTRYSFAFTNIRCVVPGHVLICSKRPISKLTQLEDHELADLMCATVKVQKAMEKLHGVGSSTVVVQDGPEAGRTVAHVHVHILPRKSGDFDRNDDIYTALAEHDAPGKEDQIALRPIAEMIAEAKTIRAAIEDIQNTKSDL